MDPVRAVEILVRSLFLITGNMLKPSLNDCEMSSKRVKPCQ